MDHHEKYSLTWHTYSDHMKVMMKEMMTSGDFADVTLVCDDKKHIRVHKNILAACSSVFKDILQVENSSVIFLKGVKFSEMQSILGYIYLGEATVDQAQIEHFFDNAKSLDIKGLNSNEGASEEKYTDEHLIIGNENETFGTRNEDYANIKNEALSADEEEVENYANIKNETLSVDEEEVENKTPKQKSSKGNENRQFKCNECHKIFCGPSGLFQHNKHVHEGITYDCSQCDIKASKKSHLKRHIERKHSE